MKPLVVIAKGNMASENIRVSLLSIVEFEKDGEDYWHGDGFDMAECHGSIIEIVPRHDAEYYIYASTHKSSSNTPVLTVHAPGNWGTAEMGGNSRTLNIACASKMGPALRKMKELALEKSLGWQVCMEVDHHGPTLSRPVMFAEIGSTEKEWQDKDAGEIVARAIVEAVRAKAPGKAHIGFGGTHYTSKFTPILLEGTELGHVIAGYTLERFGVDEEMVKQAIERNDVKIEKALLDWKGIKGETRRKLIEALDSVGIGWEKA